MKFFLYDTDGNLMPNIKTRAVSATVDQELGKYDALTATFAKTQTNVDDFKRVDKIGCEVDGQLELFKVTKPEIDDSSISVAGVESASDDLAHQSYMLASSNDSISLSTALEMVFAGTTWNYDLQAPDTNAGIDFSTGTKQEALEQVLDTWQVEAYFTYSATTSKITNQTCHIVTKRGVNTGKRLVKGVNVSSFTYSHDYSQVITGAYATGATPEKQDADTSDTDNSSSTNNQDQETTPYNLADSSWSTANGDPMNHNLGDPTLVLEDATNKYGYVDANGNRLPRMVTLSYSNDNPQQLIRHVYEYLLIHSQPAMTLTATVYKMQEASLGNRYIAIDRADGIVDASIRAIKIQRNLLNDALSEVTLGNYTIPTASERAKKQAKQTKQAEKTAKEAKEKAEKVKADTEKAAKAAKEAKDKADKAEKDIATHRANSAKRRQQRETERAQHHAQRVKEDAARDAKIAQNSKDIDDIKKSGAGGGTDVSKLGGLITLDFDEDSKTDVNTINIHSKDKSNWVIKNDGMYWKSPQQVENKTDDDKLTLPLIDMEGVLRPPRVEISNISGNGSFGQADEKNFKFNIGTPDGKNGFKANSDGTSFMTSAKSGDVLASLDSTGIDLTGNTTIHGVYHEGSTDYETGTIKISTNSDGNFTCKLDTNSVTTTIGGNGVEVDGSSIAVDPEDSDMENARITSGMNAYNDHTDDNKLMTYRDVKAIVSKAIYNAIDHGTIYEDAEKLDDSVVRGAGNEGTGIHNRGSYYKHGDKCLVKMDDFFEGGQGDEGSIMQYIMANVYRVINAKMNNNTSNQ